MQTIITRLKTLIENNNNSGGTLSYVNSVEIIHPDLSVTVHTISSLPKITFFPVSTIEVWSASQRKEATHVIAAHLILNYFQRETSIIGDSTRPGGQGKGIINFVDDFLSVVRGHRLAIDGVDYLDKPLDVTNIDYGREDLGENAYLIVAELRLEATRQFLQSSLPGNI